MNSIRTVCHPFNIRGRGDSLVTVSQATILAGSTHLKGEVFSLPYGTFFVQDVISTKLWWMRDVDWIIECGEITNDIGKLVPTKVKQNRLVGAPRYYQA
jgi:hypothetical protein